MPVFVRAELMYSAIKVLPMQGIIQELFRDPMDAIQLLI
jgi:hypothetical protein